MLRVLFVLTLSLTIAGCGFALRGSGGYELGVESVSIVGAQAELVAELEDTLNSIGVEVNPAASPQYQIQILNEATTRRPVATSGNITVSEYEVRLSSLFSISDAAGEVLIPTTELSAERVYSFDASNFVSNTEEEALLVNEMRQDLAGQLVRRFSAVLRNLSSADASQAPAS